MLIEEDNKFNRPADKLVCAQGKDGQPVGIMQGADTLHRVGCLAWLGQTQEHSRFAAMPMRELNSQS
jgi:hypothetical protein